jgi:hypothetical protein
MYSYAADRASGRGIPILSAAPASAINHPNRQVHPMSLRFSALFCLIAACMGSVSAQDRPAPGIPRFAFAFEPGINSLASIGGLALTYYPIERIAVDAGAGFGISNLRYGLRARAFFLDWKEVHPYAGLSYSHAKGWGNDTLSMSLDVTRNGQKKHYDFGMTVSPTNFLGFEGGIEFRFGHLLLRSGIGWCRQLGGRNWHVAEGIGPTGEDRKPMDLLEGSGPLGTAALGVVF